MQCLSSLSVVLVSLVFVTLVHARSASTKPNIIMLFVDDRKFKVNKNISIRFEITNKCETLH